MWRVGRCYREICSMLQPVLCGVCMTVFFLLEKRRLREKDVAYPDFAAKVPVGKGFVDNSIGGTIVLWFDDIHAMVGNKA